MNIKVKALPLPLTIAKLHATAYPVYTVTLGQCTLIMAITPRWLWPLIINIWYTYPLDPIYAFSG